MDKDEILEQVAEWPLVRTKCVCGADDSTLVSYTERLGLPAATVICRCCGTVRRLHTWDEHHVRFFYSRGWYRTLCGRRTLEERHAAQAGIGTFYRQEMLARGVDLGRVLEIGCDTGGALSAFPGSAMGEELDAEAREYAVRCDHVVAEHCAPHWPLSAIFANHVLEHTIDPVDTLRAWSERLAAGGVLLFAVPDLWRVSDGEDWRRGYASGGDEAAWQAWWRIDHVWEWTERTIRVVLERAGLDAHVQRVPAGVLATVGSLFVVAHPSGEAGVIRSFLNLRHQEDGDT